MCSFIDRVEKCKRGRQFHSDLNSLQKANSFRNDPKFNKMTHFDKSDLDENTVSNNLDEKCKIDEKCMFS